MREWVEAAGGMVHPALRLSLATPHGCRGIITDEAISFEAAQQQPVVAVPERLLLTTEVAAQQLGPALAEARARRQRQQGSAPWWALGRAQQAQQAQRERIDPTLLLMLLLATERRKGPDSFWWPYIAALPEGLPCGWALPPAELAATLAGLGSLADGWQPKIAAAAAAVQQRCEAAAAAYGPELGGVTAAEVRWALGHVVSRCFGSGDELALLPFIDLMNHQQHADTPQQYVAASGQPCAAIYNRHKGEPRAAAAGDELVISYSAGTSALNMLLNFGFVAEELR
ncbi:hypothetical protein COHA_000036 [Chlorella ohadii]|uniref:SET domain-containing protein n=1 Tax=Chlorella ohadii TaxID=2649997 RepID=A0AAD5H9A9_9CHLO|nr:hypothetical protein COHA_000036 [Chlorella ohadii]